MTGGCRLSTAAAVVVPAWVRVKASPLLPASLPTMPRHRHVAAGQRMLETAGISPLRHQSVVATGPTRSRRAGGAVPQCASWFPRVRFDTPGVSQPRRASSKSYAKLHGLPRICLFSSGLCLFQACSYKAGREAVGGGRAVAGWWLDPAAGPRGLRTSRDAPRTCPAPPHIHSAELPRREAEQDAESRQSRGDAALAAPRAPAEPGGSIW